ncbi:MAG: family 16 glycosylhydrolase [Bacteroidales bacterium]
MTDKKHHTKGSLLNLIAALALIMPVFISCEKKEVTRDIIIDKTPVNIWEDEPGGTVTLYLSLQQASDRNVTVNYSTADSTAVAGTDYTSVTNGTIEFKAGETSKSFTVNVHPNPAVKNDVYFKVTFSNPVNVNLKGTRMYVRIVNTDYNNLVWSDEFTSGPLSTATWNYELGAGGWGNNELETYTNSTNNVHIDTGYLHITALNPSGSTYTSGRITTKGKKEFTNCRVEIRAKLPQGQGLWPALWMLGANISTAGWPACGEIDIMEYLGHQTNTSYGAAHWNSNGHVYRTGSNVLSTGNYNSSFHVFSLVWTPNYLRWFVDGHEFFTKSKDDIAGFPMTLPQFFIFNVAVGGNWPGNPDPTTIFPQHMIVDYIRVYQ